MTSSLILIVSKMFNFVTNQFVNRKLSFIYKRLSFVLIVKRLKFFSFIKVSYALKFDLSQTVQEKTFVLSKKKCVFYADSANFV